MIIISQNKKSFVNFEKVNIININNTNSREIDAFFNCDESYKDNILLGIYESEKRAKEVLEEMTERIVLTQRFGAICIPERQDNMVMDMYDKEKPLFIYEMPKE